MKRFSVGIVLLCLLAFGTSSYAQKHDPWTKKELLAPAILNQQLKLPIDQRPLVIDVGPVGVIKGAVKAGPAEDKEGIEKLKSILAKADKDKEVVIYCGCCPFAKCPNIRPAFKTLLQMGFKHPRLLNLSQNLKADWISKGYPLEQE